MKSIYFVTSNARKFKEYKQFFAEHNIKLEQLEAELVEPQTVDGLLIAEHKLKQAKLMFPDKKVLVDDRGFSIEALNNFPGTMLKLTLDTLGVEGIEKLMKGVENRDASFFTVLGYYDGSDDHYFHHEEKGFLTERISGDNLRGWTELLYLYGHPTNPGKSLAQLTDKEWNKYVSLVESENVLDSLRSIL